MTPKIAPEAPTEGPGPAARLRSPPAMPLAKQGACFDDRLAVGQRAGGELPAEHRKVCGDEEQDQRRGVAHTALEVDAPAPTPVAAREHVRRDGDRLFAWAPVRHRRSPVSSMTP